MALKAENIYLIRPFQNKKKIYLHLFKVIESFEGDLLIKKEKTG